MKSETTREQICLHDCDNVREIGKHAYDMPWRSAIAKKPTQRNKVVHKKIPWSEEELARGKRRGLARTRSRMRREDEDAIHAVS
jgi:hypothetical protein